MVHVDRIIIVMMIDPMCSDIFATWSRDEYACDATADVNSDDGWK